MNRKEKKMENNRKEKYIKLLLCHLLLAGFVTASAFGYYLIHHLHYHKQATTTARTQNENTLSNAGTLKEKGGISPTPTDRSSKETGKVLTENEQQGVSETSEPKTADKTLTLSMVGDVLLHASISKSGLRKNGTYNYDHFFKHVKKKIKSYDVAMINEEVLLAGPAFGISGYPKFNGRFEVGDAIEKAGFDVILHATNHSMDQGKAGLLSDLNHWKKAHPKLKVTGMYRTKKEADKITYIKKNGIKLAILNYTYGTNGIALPSDMPYAVNLMTEGKVKRDVKIAKKHADFVIVCPHWGTEYKDNIDEYQKKWTRFFLKLKVDLVIGAHPHVIEPVKWISDKKGHKMLVYYSLGNYINSTARKAKSVYRQYLGGMADVTIEKRANGKTSIKKASFIPLITHYCQNRKVMTFFFKDYSEKKAKQSRLSQRDKYFSYSAAKKHFKKVIRKTFLKDL